MESLKATQEDKETELQVGTALCRCLRRYWYSLDAEQPVLTLIHLSYSPWELNLLRYRFGEDVSSTSPQPLFGNPSPTPSFLSSSSTEKEDMGRQQTRKYNFLSTDSA